MLCLSLWEKRPETRENLLDANMSVPIYKLGAQIRTLATNSAVFTEMHAASLSVRAENEAKTFGIQKFTTTITVHQNQKERKK